MDDESTERDVPQRPEYEAPELTALGTVSEITRANESSSMDTPVP